MKGRSISNLRGKRLARVLGIVGATCFCLQGYDQAVANGLLTLPTFISVFPSIDTSSDDLTAAQKSHNATVQGAAVALYEVGAAFGALACAFVGDRLGRRRTVFGAAITCLIGIIIQTTPFSLGQLIAGRIITGMLHPPPTESKPSQNSKLMRVGLGVGAFTATVPMWVSECTKADHRGRLVLLEGWFAIAGVALATWIDFGFFYAKNSSVSWRFPIAFQAIFAIIVVSCCLFLPESPRWLVKNDRAGDAAAVLARLDDLPEDSTIVNRETAMIQQSLVDEHIGTSSSPFALTENKHLQRTLLAIGANLFAQMSGINIVTFYSDSIFENQLHYSGTTARIISGCLQIWQFLAAGLAVLLIDRFGRRRLLIFAATGMTISQACLAGLSSDLSNTSAASASIFFYFMALFCFPIGMFLIPFMYAAEIAPLRIRSQVTALSAGTNWLLNFMVAMVTPVGFANIAWRYYVIYAAINFVAIWAFYFCYPETKGRTLEEIDRIFIESKSFWDTVRVARALPFQEEVMQEQDMKEAERGREAWRETA